MHDGELPVKRLVMVCLFQHVLISFCQIIIHESLESYVEEQGLIKVAVSAEQVFSVQGTSFVQNRKLETQIIITFAY